MKKVLKTIGLILIAIIGIAPAALIMIHRYVKNTELIDIMYETLASGKPVPFTLSSKRGARRTGCAARSARSVFTYSYRF